MNIGADWIIGLMQQSMESLCRTGVIEASVHLDRDTILLGDGSSLDSMGFVTFVADVEERLNRETGKDLYIVLTELEDVYPNSTALSAAMFADYLEALAAR